MILAYDLVPTRYKSMACGDKTRITHNDRLEPFLYSLFCPKRALLYK